jgi:elongation factor P--(R)-beta-lysine ligase
MRPKRSTPKIMHRAGELRSELTPAEHKLWAQLRNDQLGVNFRRQHAIGNYIVDFCSPRKKLIIELDGGQHLEQEAYDRERTEFLQSKGYRVLRFWNDDVIKDMNGMVQVILDALNSP